MTVEYKRIRDDREAEWDDLEKTATALAKQGWRVLTISDGSNFRTATLYREVPDQVSNVVELPHPTKRQQKTSPTAGPHH